jgi:hypothetical protein
MALNQSSPSFDYRINLGQSSLLDYINRTAYEQIKQEQETSEILNNLRMKYLPNSVRSYSFNKSLNVTNYQRNNSNKILSSFTNDNNNYQKPSYNSFNKDNSNNKKINIKSYKSDRLIPNSIFEQKDLYNLEESLKFNKENINNENIQKKEVKIINKENKYKDKLLIEENDNLKKMNEGYKLIISSLIEYINELSIYFIGKNTLELNYINNLFKTNNFKIDYTALNNLKSKLKAMKNNIFNYNTINKSLSMPLTSEINNILEQERKPIIKEKETNLEKYTYKPVIFDRNEENFSEKMAKSVDRSGVKKSRTWFDRLPKTYWSLNKKLKLRDIKK